MARTVWYEAGWFPYLYGFVPDERAWKRSLSKMAGRAPAYPDSAGCTSFFKQIGVGTPVAVVTVLPRPPRETIELLAHEGMHVWRDIRQAMGEHEPSSELEAYAIQNILSNLMIAYEKTRGSLFARRRRQV